MLSLLLPFLDGRLASDSTPTSTMLWAKTERARKELSRGMMQRSFKKVYLAIVQGKLPVRQMLSINQKIGECSSFTSLLTPL